MSEVYGKQLANTPAFLNPNDPVVSVVLGAQQTVLEDAEAALATAHQIVSVVGATGDDLDFIASIYGVQRLAQETDAHLLGRIPLTVDSSVSPNNIARHLQSISQTAQFYEPAGGSFVAWNPLTNYRYDRENVAMTWARSTAAFSPTGAESAANAPTWSAQGIMQWAGVFQGTSNILLNSRFLTASGTPSLPTSWAVAPASGGTITWAAGGAYSGGYLTLSNTTAGASAGTVTQNAGTIVQAPYTVSAYVSGPVALSVVAQNGSGTFDSPAASTYGGTVDGLLYVTYTPSTGFVDNCTVTISGQGTVYAVQLEESQFPSPIIPNDSTTAGTVATRAADTFTIPAASVVGAQSQGMIALSVDVGAYGAWETSGVSFHTTYLLDWEGALSIWSDGQTLHALIGGVTLSATAAFSQGEHIVALNWGQGSATLVMDGVALTTATVASPPTSVSGSVYIGSDYTGANQANGFVGNLCFSEAQWMASRVLALQAGVAIPVYAPTLCSAAWFSQTLAGIAGGMTFGVANYVGVYVPTASSGGFVLDASYLDAEYMTNPSDSQLSLLKALIFPLFAGGKKTFQWSPGNPT